LIRITDRTLSSLDGLPHDKPALSRFLALLIELDPGAIELSERVFRLLSPLPEYPSYVLRAGRAGRRRLFQIQNHTLGDYDKVRICGMDGALRGDYRRAFARLRELFNGNVEFCPTNRFHCATALAAEWVISGAGSDIVTSFGGIGGLAPTEELMMILRMNGLRGADRVYGFLPEMSRLFSKIAKMRVRPNKPVIGKRIFHVESSIHVDGILKQPECYEPFPPETVGQARRIILGKQSGAASIRAKLAQFNITRGEERVPAILEKVKAMAAAKRGAVTDREFVKIARGVG